MYQFDWASKPLWDREGAAVQAAPSALPRDHVAETLLVHWQEHCVECAPPQCYEVCPLYVARADRKCARFLYGVYPNERFRGLFDHGADIRFRRWAKIEAELGGGTVSVDRHRRLDRLDAAVTRGVNAAAGALAAVNPTRRLNGALTLLRDAALRRAAGSDGATYDEFVLECYAPDPEPFRLILELVRGHETALRHAFEIRPGHNFHTLSAALFGALDGEGDGARALLYPEDDAERRAIFTWLDFVRYVPREQPAAKVKCVAWDLDRTLWEGVLLEDGESGCRPRPEARALVQALDQRGVLQTIVSKNDHDHAWAHVEQLGLAEYFLYPAINWGSKSENLKQVAKRLNLGLDTIALIDDSAFERAEVQAALPMVRVYAEGELTSLLDYAELDVPVTEMARARRLSYLAELERGRAHESFGGDYLDFLRTTAMRMRVFVPTEEREVMRCVELIQRSNQLNLSTRRYSRDQVVSLLATEGMLCAAVECEDRFGRYGIVGFAVVDERGEVPVVLDYVLSCRVAQKRVEHTFFGWLAARERERGAPRLRAELVRTDRNAPLVRVFEELPFRPVAEEGVRRVLEWELAEHLEDEGVIELRSEL